jgi:hypothetical protein
MLRYTATWFLADTAATGNIEDVTHKNQTIRPKFQLVRIEILIVVV